MSDAPNGSCLCGAVAFRFELPSLFHVHCHCRMCQRAHGAAFVTWVGVADERFELTEGREQLTWFASSELAERGFCGRCGTTLFFKSEQWPGEIHIATALITGALDRAPERHVFFDTHVAWAAVGDSLPRRPAGSDGA